MKLEIFPTQEELERYEKKMPEIDPAAVIAMLQIKQAAEEIRMDINQILEDRYQLSEGKLRVLVVLHQNPAGMAPSALAARTGVTRATISVMVRRMVRDGLVASDEDAADKRAKTITLTKKGRDFMEEVLPGNYLRISRLMGRLSAAEQQELIRLLQKLTAG